MRWFDWGWDHVAVAEAFRQELSELRNNLIKSINHVMIEKSLLIVLRCWSRVGFDYGVTWRVWWVEHGEIFLKIKKCLTELSLKLESKTQNKSEVT